MHFKVHVQAVRLQRKPAKSHTIFPTRNASLNRPATPILNNSFIF